MGTGEDKMSKKTKKVRRRGRRRRGFSSWSIWKKLGVFFVCILLTVLAAGIVIVASKVEKLDIVELDTDALNISNEVEHETGYLNVALFGLDSREGTLGEGNRSDTMMIASLNLETKEVRLVSVFRDTLLQLSDGSYNKANAAYSFGGPEAAIGLLNKNMDMNIEKYVAVNFNVLVDVIDAVGGIDVYMSYDEVVHMNNYCVETSAVTGKDYTPIEPATDTFHLNGVQAVSYARIRYTSGGDIERAARQRLVISKIVEKAQNMNITTLNRIIDSVFPNISTNFTLTEMASYAKDYKEYILGESLGFPSQHYFDMITGVGSVVIADTLALNVEEVHQFLFGDNGYTASSTVVAIGNEVAYRAAQAYEAPESGEEDDDEYYTDDGDDYSGYTEESNNNYDTGTGDEMSGTGETDTGTGNDSSTVTTE